MSEDRQKIIYKQRPIQNSHDASYIMNGIPLTSKSKTSCGECSQKPAVCNACKELFPCVIELTLGEFGTGTKTAARRFSMAKLGEGSVLIDFRISGDKLVYMKTQEDPSKKLLSTLVSYYHPTSESFEAIIKPAHQEQNPHENPVMVGFDISPDGKYINCIAVELPAQVFQKTYEVQMKDILQNIFIRHYTSRHRYNAQMYPIKPNPDKLPMILETKLGKWAMLTLLDEFNLEPLPKDTPNRGPRHYNPIPSRGLEARPEAVEFLHVKPAAGSAELVYYYAIVTQNCLEVLLFKMTIQSTKTNASSHELVFKTQSLWSPVCGVYQSRLQDKYLNVFSIVPYQRTVTILNRGKDKILQIAIKPSKKSNAKKAGASKAKD